MKLTSQIYKLQSGHYQISVYNPITKRRKRFNFKLLRDAEQYQRTLRNQFAANGVSESSTTTIGQWMNTYLELYPRAFIKRLGNPLHESFIKAFGDRLVIEVTRSDIMAWISQVQTTRNYSQRTIPNIKSAAQQFFQFLVDAGAINVNPVIKIKINKGTPKRERVTLSEVEINEMLEQIKALSSNQVYPVAFLLAHTGARLGEILKLTWSCVRFDLEALHLLKTKNDEDRLIQVSSKVIEFLQALPRVGETVVLNVRGEALTDSQYQKQFTKIRRKIAFDKYWSNHSFRHSFAVNYLNQGGDMTQLQKILGHKHLDMTVGLYGQIRAQDILNPSPFDF